MIRKKLEERKKQEEKEKEKKAKARKDRFNYISKKIKSDDTDRLNQILNITNELLQKEKERGESAEKRISTFFSVGTVISGLFSILGKYLVLFDGNLVWLISLIYVAILILILKIGYYFFDSIRTRINHFIGPSDIYPIIKKENKNQALQYEIARKLIDYYDQTIPNNQKLFCLEQMQNNLILIIIYFLSLGILGILNTNSNIRMPQTYSITIGLAFIIIAAIFDIVYVRIRRKFWKFK
mgnify:CR=1 FL=1